MQKSVKGQMKLSFGMIFSIILIIVFVAFAFYAISKLLGFQEQITVVQFRDELQKDIDATWKANENSEVVEYGVPRKVEKVCFIDYGSGKKGLNLELYDKLKQVFYETENVFFYPIGSTEGQNSFVVNHIDLEATTTDENPLCFNVKNRKIEMIVQMNYGESLVTVLRK